MRKFILTLISGAAILADSPSYRASYTGLGEII